MNRSTGTRIFSVSGHVNRPGNYEVELGMTFRELIYDLAGGIRDGKELEFFIPGGASSPWLIAATSTSTRRSTWTSCSRTYGAMLGSGAVMVFDETVDPLLVAWRLAKFFAHESCGKCTPCREGTGWIEKVLYRMVARPRPSRGPRPAARRSATTSRPGLDWPPGHDHDLPARPERDVAGREPQQASSRRDHRAHDRRHRASRRAEVTRRMTTDAIPMSQWPSEHAT